MEELQVEIERLLDIITVLLVKLETAAQNDVVSDIKIILDKSRSEVQLIQQSLLGKIKQEEEEYFSENEDNSYFMFNPQGQVKECDIVKEEAKAMEYENTQITAVKYSSPVQIDFVKKTEEEGENSLEDEK